MFPRWIKILTLQEDALQYAGCEKILHEKISGSNTERIGRRADLELLRKGDTLLVWRLDRLGRFLIHLIETVSYKGFIS